MILHIVCITSTIALLFGGALFLDSSPSEYEVLGVDEVHELIEVSGEDLQILDVRTPDEFQLAHIYGAVNINVRDLDFAEQISVLEQDMPILVYCKSGVRAELAASILISKGFTMVYLMKGEFDTWVNAGYPVSKEVVA
jgi:rhodanese-related sulfurtransferase